MTFSNQNPKHPKAQSKSQPSQNSQCPSIISKLLATVTKAVFGSCKIFSGKYVFSGNAIFRKGKYLQVFGCILKIFLENIFMCLGVF